MIHKKLGILGGGQLGRMASLAASRLGIKTHIYAPEENCPGAQVATWFTQAEYDDTKALKAFADSVDAITYEFENIPLDTVRFLQQYCEVSPNDRLLEIAQDRIKEKKFLNDIGIETARWQEVTSPDGIADALSAFKQNECILKTTRMGYDGKGQMRFKLGDDTIHAYHSLVPERSSKIQLIAEEIVDFSCEVSVVIARDKLGQTAVYTPVLNEHRDHILYKTTAPAPIPSAQMETIKKKAELLAGSVDLIGVLAIELFITTDGKILANEIAPRPHNSGHWTIDACSCSQFEQQVRTVCSLNVGHPHRHSDAVMVNLIGDDVKKVKRVVLCSGKVYYDLLEERESQKIKDVAILRLEQYYPFPDVDLTEELKGYPKLEEVVWCQEEPENMGAWFFVDRRIEAVLAKLGGKATRPLYAGRPAAASPAAGYPKAHKRKQQALVDQALKGEY